MVASLIALLLALRHRSLIHGISLLEVLYRLFSGAVKQLHNAVHIPHSIVKLFFERVRLAGTVRANGCEILSDVFCKFPELFSHLCKDALVLLGKVLNKVAVRQHVRHGLGYDFPACRLIAEPFAVHLFFNQVIRIFAPAVDGFKHSLSEFIILDWVPIFNKMNEFMGECAQHGILGHIANIGILEDSGVSGFLRQMHRFLLYF